MVRELFEMARTKKACIIFFDEIDAIGGEALQLAMMQETNENNRNLYQLITCKHVKGVAKTLF